MKKQTKLVAVLSTAALLAIGASMTSFAATGWAEEDGTWVYYNRDGERATDSWKKSGNNWYYLDSDGEMAIDQLIEDGDNYYYVDINGVMASNQWVAIENEDAGEDDEPEHYWYYFQANGKALTNGDNAKVALKTINGKKYAFDEEGKMLYGWVAEDNAERIDNTDGDAFKEGDYYFGGEDDGAMTTGWLQMDITYEEATTDNFVAPVFNEDEDQTRWFYFQSNGKKVKADETKNDTQKGKTINGKKYEFDQKGVMTAEWSLDVDKITSSAANDPATRGNAAENSTYAKYAHQWRYFNSVEDGARVSKGWFKVVPAEMLNTGKYDDDEDAWYYADGSGKLYAGEFKTIKGKKYAFRTDGRMVSGLKFISDDGNGNFVVKADDNDEAAFGPFDTEDDFLANAPVYEAQGYKCYYFGDGDDGAMRTNKTSITIDGDKFNFYFQKSGGNKGAGITGEKDDKYYQSGMLMTAGSDEKYQIITPIMNGTQLVGYDKYADVADLVDGNIFRQETSYTDASLRTLGINKDADEIAELYVPVAAASAQDHILINTSGKVIDNKGKSKDGNDYYYVVNGSKKVVAIYLEN
ncbi:argininosuccinate lyase [Enterocloster sp. HCN-30185]|uniref:argininosuccinate lyase n=1 Tax=Enterocloster sp. HCN-30185 TaxID=3134663 RepID=UPI0030BAA23F